MLPIRYVIAYQGLSDISMSKTIAFTGRIRHMRTRKIPHTSSNSILENKFWMKIFRTREETFSFSQISDKLVKANTRTRNISNKEHIEQGTHRTRNISNKEHIEQGTHRTRNISNKEHGTYEQHIKEHIEQGTHRTRNISNKEHIEQGRYRTRNTSYFTFKSIYYYLFLFSIYLFSEMDQIITNLIMTIIQFKYKRNN